MTAHLDWSALAHRALVTAALYGLGARSRAPKVVCSTAGELARTCATAPDVELVVTVDGPELDATTFAAARDAGAADGVLAVVIASASALGLLSIPPPHTPERTDAFARAGAWATLAARGLCRAPAVSAARLREIAGAASSAGLALVEPEVPHVRIQPRHPVDRAVFATIALGATARALLFVREGRAPKGGLARLRDERLLDGWIEGRGMRASSASLRDAAIETLAHAPGPMRGKDLLREARVRWTEAARAAGTRATTSSADASVLAKDLRLLWLDGAIEVYASDPATPLVTT